MWMAPAHCELTGVVPDAGLRGTMVAVMVCAGVGVVGVGVMAVRLGECGRRNQHQEQGCEDNLLHGLRVAPGELLRKCVDRGESESANQERKQGAGLREPSHVATGGWDSRQMNEA
jgi:hypothetical protein